MTFEEFFKKKKINLTTLQQAEGSLFAEFKDHFELMGEKSFDHTKKYWFNKLRRQFPAPIEVKAEKVIIENPLAEQTVAESLTEPIAEQPKVGFTPRFKAGATAAKPVEPIETTTPSVSEDATDTAKTATTAKPGFTPRFKAGVTSSKTEESSAEPKTEEQKAEEAAKPALTAKPGFTPRFKAGVTSSAPKPQEPAEQPIIEEEKPVEPVQPAKVGFTPRFKAGVTKTATEVPIEQPKVEEEKPAEPAQPAKVGFTPRFKAGVTKPAPPKPPEE